LGRLYSHSRSDGKALTVPFLSTGCWHGNTTLAYTQDYDNIYIEPLTFSLNVHNSRWLNALWQKFLMTLCISSLYAKQRLYQIDFSNSMERTYHESSVGLKLDLLLFHKLEMPLS